MIHISISNISNIDQYIRGANYKEIPLETSFLNLLRFLISSSAVSEVLVAASFPEKFELIIDYEYF